MYRTIGLHVSRAGIQPGEPDKVSELIQSAAAPAVSLTYVEGEQHVLLNGEDVSGLIRTPEMSRYFAQYPARSGKDHERYHGRA